ncbi:MAG: STAS domain-containing protein [Clostridia bacterium]|nr:STAS domain-containing protein [Clostridia bacterium]
MTVIYAGYNIPDIIMSKNDIAKIREEVNPVFNTARSCLQITSSLGDEDSEKLCRILGFSSMSAEQKENISKLPPKLAESLAMAMPAFNVAVEARFLGMNNYIRETGAKQVLDLPCGYTSRGIKLAGSGIKYFGTDLPAVIDEIKPAVKQLIGDNKNITYSAVDATNHASLRKAVDGANGELTIATEGLLVYFSQTDLETVFGNIRKLLLEFGGRWITPDNELHVASGKILSALLTGMPSDAAVQIADMAAGNAAKTKVSNNIFFDKDLDKAKKFVSDMGFQLELVPISKYMPGELSSFRQTPKEARDRAMKVLNSVNYWVMTPKTGITENFSYEEEKFNAAIQLNDNTLNVSLSGRLDTISAPGLLALYRDAADKSVITDVTIDCTKLDYVSSAGLRVFLIIQKSCASGVTLTGVSPDVESILEQTAFDSILNIEKKS